MSPLGDLWTLLTMGAPVEWTVDEWTVEYTVDERDTVLDEVVVRRDRLNLLMKPYSHEVEHLRIVVELDAMMDSMWSGDG